MIRNIDQELDRLLAEIQRACWSERLKKLEQLSQEQSRRWCYQMSKEAERQIEHEC